MEGLDLRPWAPLASKCFFFLKKKGFWIDLIMMTQSEVMSVIFAGHFQLYFVVVVWEVFD